MRSPLTTALSGLQKAKEARLGPYGSAAIVLTIKDLFRLLPRRSQEELLDLLVALVVADDPAVPANTVEIRGDPGVTPAASGSTEPCKGSRRVFHKRSP